VNPGGANGLFFGNPHQFVIQSIGVGATMAYSFIGSAVILKIIDVTLGLRITSEEEVQGLDITQHSEIGYSI
jgi:Amt family ammonium transporter